MEHSKQILLTRRMLDLQRTGRIETEEACHEVDTDRYRSPERHERERRQFSLESPQLLALSAEIPDPGDFTTLQIAGLPVLLVRHNDGQARAFINACKHRGARLAEGRGTSPHFTCPYHNWTYANDGTLKGTPHSYCFDDVDLSNRNLTSLPTCEWNGLVFVHADPATSIDPEQILGSLAPELSGFDFSQLRFVNQETESVRVNWKLGVDFVMEGYHVQYLHRDTVGQAAVPSCAHDVFGPHTRMTSANKSIVELEDTPESEWKPLEELSLIHCVFPNAMLIVSQAVVIFQRIDPSDTPNWSDSRLATFSWQEASPEALKIDDFLFRSLVHVQRNEDLALMKNAQRGFDAGTPKTILFGRAEPLLHHVHRTFDRELRD